MIRILTIVAVAAGLSACAVPATPITGPDGRQAFVMKCSGFGRDRGSCLAKAGDLCPRGYAVVDDNSSQSGGMQIGNVFAIAHRAYLTISCRG